MGTWTTTVLLASWTTWLRTEVRIASLGPESIGIHDLKIWQWNQLMLGREKIWERHLSIYSHNLINRCSPREFSL